MTEIKDTTPLDTEAILAALADFWADPRPGRYSGQMPRRIAGTAFDQAVPEGVENPYWEIVRQMPLDDMPAPWRKTPEPSAYYFTDEPGSAGLRYVVDRHALCGTYSWSICSPGDIKWIAGLLDGRGVVEVGAGGGYWAWQMRQARIDVAAYDPNVPGEQHFSRREWSPVLRGDASAAANHPDRVLFLCWPSYGEPWAAHALASYRGDTLIYAGEGEGGCCADDAFFELLNAEWDEIGESPAHVSYVGIHCFLTAYRRKG